VRVDGTSVSLDADHRTHGHGERDFVLLAFSKSTLVVSPRKKSVPWVRNQPSSDSQNGVRELHLNSARKAHIEVDSDVVQVRVAVVTKARGGCRSGGVGLGNHDACLCSGTASSVTSSSVDAYK
jgi:hypothetical protein